jgi:hypothetical protein
MCVAYARRDVSRTEFCRGAGEADTGRLALAIDGPLLVGTAWRPDNRPFAIVPWMALGRRAALARPRIGYEIDRVACPARSVTARRRGAEETLRVLGYDGRCWGMLSPYVYSYGVESCGVPPASVTGASPSTVVRAILPAVRVAQATRVRRIAIPPHPCRSAPRRRGTATAHDPVRSCRSRAAVTFHDAATMRHLFPGEG